MKITVSCQKCGKILLVAQKDTVNQDDLDMYTSSCSCDTDGPFPAVMGIDENGNPVELEPAVDNTIIAAMTAN